MDADTGDVEVGAASATTRSPRSVTAALAERYTGAVYGTLVGASVVAAIGSSKTASPAQVFATMVVTSVIFWAAHVFSRVLGLSMLRGRQLTMRESRVVAKEEWPMIAAVIPLSIPLALGVLGVLPERAAIWTSMIVAVLALGAWGFRIGQLEKQGTWRAIRLSLVTASFGIAITLLKAVLSH